MMGVIRRSFLLNETMFKHLYKNLVQPHLKYAVGPTCVGTIQKEDINELESVQRRVTKLVPSLRNLGYVDRLRT